MQKRYRAKRRSLPLSLSLSHRFSPLYFIINAETRKVKLFFIFIDDPRNSLKGERLGRKIRFANKSGPGRKRVRRPKEAARPSARRADRVRRAPTAAAGGRDAQMKTERSYSAIRPSRVMVTTCHGIKRPLLLSAVSVMTWRPPQQGTSMRTTVTLLMPLSAMICVSFSE